MTVSDADNGIVVNRRRKRVFTGANEGNEDGAKGVRSGLSQSQRDSFKGDAAPEAFTFVVFVSFCEKSHWSADALRRASCCCLLFHLVFNPHSVVAIPPERLDERPLDPRLAQDHEIRMSEKHPGGVTHDEFLGLLIERVTFGQFHLRRR